jgi:hypothetical protein
MLLLATPFLTPEVRLKKKPLPSSLPIVPGSIFNSLMRNGFFLEKL